MNTKSIDDPSVFPTRENCDRNDPEQRFLWMMVGLPRVTGGAMPMPVPMLKILSAHYVDLGMMDICPKCGHQETPKKHLVLPDDPHALLNPGVWEDGPAPAKTRPSRRDVLTKMTSAELAALRAEAAAILDNRDTQGGIQ